MQVPSPGHDAKLTTSFSWGFFYLNLTGTITLLISLPSLAETSKTSTKPLAVLGSGQLIVTSEGRNAGRSAVPVVIEYHNPCQDDKQYNRSQYDFSHGLTINHPQPTGKGIGIVKSLSEPDEAR